jgi:aryl-alcohol dehydrogenase-like predicted oxidoreductase
MQHEINRRTFIKTSAGAVAATMAGAAYADSPAQAGSLAALRADTVVTLGESGVQCSALGFGTGVRAWNGNSALIRRGDDHFMDTMAHACSKGVNFLDLADMYGSHEYARRAMHGPDKFIERDQVMILTKTVSREASLVKEDIERFRKELDTDMIDVVLLHCLTQPGWTTDLQAVKDVLEDAKAKGQIRAQGVSCHNFECMEEAAEDPWVDVMLSRINPFGTKMDNTPEEVARVLRKAKANGKGNLGMKIIGEGTHPDQIGESLQFVFGLGCIDAVTIGFLEPREVDGIFDYFAELA